MQWWALKRIDLDIFQAYLHAITHMPGMLKVHIPSIFAFQRLAEAHIRRLWSELAKEVVIFILEVACRFVAETQNQEVPLHLTMLFLEIQKRNAQGATDRQSFNCTRLLHCGGLHFLEAIFYFVSNFTLLFCLFSKNDQIKRTFSSFI